MPTITKEKSILYKLEKKSDNKTISVSLIVDVLCVLVLLYGMVRNGFDNYNISINYLMIAVIILQLIFKRKISKRIAMMELIPFSIIILLEFPLQKLLTDGYYGWSSALSGIITFLLMVVTLQLLIGKNTDKFWKIINTVALVSSVLIIIQSVFFYLFGIRLDQVGMLGKTFFSAWNYSFYRPSSLFSEPSHFAELTLLSLYYYLFKNKSRIKLLIIIFGLVLSTSSLGIIGAILLLLLYVLNLGSVSNVKIWKKVLLYMLTIVGIVLLFFYSENTDNIVVNRIMSGSTANVRVNRSFELFDIMPIDKKVIGIGIQNQEKYLNYHGVVLPSDTYETTKTNREFAQTLGYILCTTGLIGLIALFVPLLMAVLKNDYKLRVFFILFVYVCLTCCIFSRSTFLIYLLMFYEIKNFKEVRKNEI